MMDKGGETMDTDKVNRREVLRGAAVAGIATAAGLWPGRAADARSARRAGAGAMLSADEMAAIDQALGKKGTVVQNEAIYMVPLPRNDLKFAIQGEPVPIPL